MTDSISLRGPAPPNVRADTGRSVRPPGQFGSRTVRVREASRDGPSVGEPKASSKPPIHARTITQGPTIASGPGTSFALGEIGAFDDFLADNVEGHEMSRELLPDLKTALGFAKQVDDDILRASTLLEKSERGPLTEAEQREVNVLMASSRHNLSQVQGWLSEKGAELREAGAQDSAAATFVRNLQERLADRHMDVADLICLHDLDLTDGEETVSRSDRINAHLLEAEAALTVARNLSVPGLSDASRQELITTLEEHVQTLGTAKALAENPQAAGFSAGDGLELAGKELWGTPFALSKGGKDSDSIRHLQAHWDAKSWDAGTQGPWLPLAHPKLGQTRMLQEFIGHRLKAAGVRSRDIPDLKFQMREAKIQAVNDQDWDAIHTDVRYTLRDRPHEAHSTITPAKAMSSHFAEDYASNGVNCADRMQYKHVPNLAHTELRDETGNVLFSGLRHGVLDAYNLTASNLRKLPDAQLRPLIEDLLVPAGSSPDARATEVDRQLTAIRSGSSEAGKVATRMRAAASRNMAEELATAALVSDPEKLDAALAGETVDLNLNSISLLTPDVWRTLGKSSSNERDMLANQTRALKYLGGPEQPVELRVRDGEGNLHTVKANVNVRAFNFGVNGGAVGRMGVGKLRVPSHTPVWKQHAMGWGFAMQRNDPELVRLLGADSRGELGGDVADKLLELDRSRKQLNNDIRSGRLTGEDLAQARARSDALGRQYRTLYEAASAAKQIWRDESYAEGGADPYKMVSRLALVGHLMDETPLFNCKSGKDRTGQLDAEVKYLAALGEQGALPAPGAPSPELRNVRSEFTLNTGNLEMQRLNTGLPGYKLKRSEVPGLANMLADRTLEPVYRGGSDYVKA